MSFSPTLGRFLETDPDSYVDGPNLYQGYRSNPVSMLDPLGTAAAPTTKPTTLPTTQPHDRATCPICARNPFPDDATDTASNCDRYAFGLGKELMDSVVGEAIDAKIVQGFGKDLDNGMGGSWLDKDSNKLERALDNFFKKHPDRGHKLANPNDDCPCGYRKVAAQNYNPGYLRGRDYHFARQNPDGTWSDKLRGGQAGSCRGPYAKGDSSPQGIYCVKIPK